MSSKLGYFSLIQYCPDRSRQETVNVGLLLLSPADSFLDCRMSSRNKRATALLGHKGAAPQRQLSHAKRALADRIRNSADEIRSPEELERFAGSRGNDLILTPPKACRVMNPEAELHRLFEELVESEQRGRPSRQSGSTPAEGLRRERKRHYARLREEIATERQLRVEARTRAERAEAAAAGLWAFVSEMFEKWVNDGCCGDVDGGDFQELMEKHSITVQRKPEPGTPEHDEWGDDAELHYLREDGPASIAAAAEARIRAEAMRECRSVAAHFSMKPDRSLHPDIPWENMKQEVQMAAHSTAQQIAMEIDALLPAPSPAVADRAWAISDVMLSAREQPREGGRGA